MIRSVKRKRKQLTRASGKNASNASLPHRGRPTKSSQLEILKTGSEPIAREFRFRPLRTPVDVQFAPYYERVLKGDLSAIGEYVDRNAVRSNLDPSFYELLGRLATIRFYAAADFVLADIERRGNIGSVTDKQADEYWYKRLLPLAEKAEKWIRRYIKNDSSNWNRATAWAAYAEETCKDDWERTVATPRPPICDLERHRIIYYNSEQMPWREHYMRIGLVPKEIFWLLAKQRGAATHPSWSVRKYLQQWDADIKARMKSLRKRNH